jgi:hypothetical protein
MKTQKKFDCLRMKEDIQTQLRKKWRGKSRQQIREEISHFLATSENSVAAWWRSLEVSKSSVSK